MLLQQSEDDLKSKDNDGFATEETTPETSVSNVWVTKKSQNRSEMTKVNVISTNLTDSSVDPSDYTRMENSMSQSDVESEPKNNKTDQESPGIAKANDEENFI